MSRPTRIPQTQYLRTIESFTIETLNEVQSEMHGESRWNTGPKYYAAFAIWDIIYKQGVYGVSLTRIGNLHQETMYTAEEFKGYLERLELIARRGEG